MISEWADPIIAYAQSNQFLVGGVGTLLTGGAMWALRAIPSQIWKGIKGVTTLELDVTTRYNQFNEIALLLGHYSIRPLTRQYAPALSSSRYGNTEAVDGLTPGFGRGFAWYKGTLITFDKNKLEGSTKIEEQLRIGFFTRSVDVITGFIREARSFSGKDMVRIKISDGEYFGSTTFKEKRSLESVFVDAQVKSSLVDRMSWFVDNEAWYRRRGIPYKFCGLLYGKPGTGKTSLVHAIASHFNLNIAYITSLNQISTLISECKEDDLVVIEDIDALAMGLDRREEDDSGTDTSKSVPVLHKLLNALDGFCSPHGLKVLMTTNYVERLDPAILRRGRTDLMLPIGYLRSEEICAMFQAFYETDAQDLMKLMPDGIEMSGADLQDIFTTHTAVEASARLMALQ